MLMDVELAPDTKVLIGYTRSDGWELAQIVHKMGVCVQCGVDRYHCRLVETGEDAAVCRGCIWPLN